MAIPTTGLLQISYAVAGNPWAAPNGWDTLHPQLNLNLDDQTPYLVYNRAVHVATEVSLSSKYLCFQKFVFFW